MSGAGCARGEVAAAAGVNRQTLRYYERRGLLDRPPRSLGGHRLYPGETVTALRVIKAAQRLGFTLDEVAELLDAGRHRHGRRRDPGLGLAGLAGAARVACRVAPVFLAAGVLGGAGLGLRR